MIYMLPLITTQYSARSKHLCCPCIWLHQVVILSSVQKCPPIYSTISARKHMYMDTDRHRWHRQTDTHTCMQCIHKCACACTRTHMHTHTHTCMHARTHTRAHTHTHTQMHRSEIIRNTSGLKMRARSILYGLKIKGPMLHYWSHSSFWDFMGWWNTTNNINTQKHTLHQWQNYQYGNILILQ